MINSRKIEDLHPHVQNLCRQFVQKCEEAGLDIIITSTFRDQESQAELYAQGRTKPGKKVTNAPPGKSWHNWRVAFDIVPLRNGKPVWGSAGNGMDNDSSDDERDDLELWQRIGAIGKSVGLEGAGDWVSFKEFPHFQFTGGLTLTEFANGKTLMI